MATEIEPAFRISPRDFSFGNIIGIVIMAVVVIGFVVVVLRQT